jgi:membrane associated rhomboid family serine protease
MLLPIGSERHSDDLPWMTIAIIVVCTALHLWLPPMTIESIAGNVEAFCNSTSGQNTGEALGLECEDAAIRIIQGKAKPLNPESKRLIKRAESQLDVFAGAFQPKKFSFLSMITSAFLHGGWAHLIGNMLFLWLFGRVLEDYIGPFKLLALFIGANVFADAIYTMTYMVGLVEGLPALGASAGIYGIMAGVWRVAPSLRFDAIFWVLMAVRKIQIPAKILTGFYVLSDLASLMLHGLGAVNFLGHLAGFAFVFFLMEQREVKKKTATELTASRYDISPDTI